MLAGRGAAAAVIIVVAAAYPGHLLASSPLSAAGETMAMQDNDAIIKFASLSAYDSNHDYLGKIKEDTTFKSGEPVFLQANFTNLGDPAGSSGYYYYYYTVVIEVRNSDAPETVALSSVHTKLAAAGAGDDRNSSNLVVETYWKPDQKANYTILVFLQKSGDLNKTPVQHPVASVRVQVS